MNDPKATIEQVIEWVENPVTVALHELIVEELTAIRETPVTDCLIAGSPSRSHENLVEIEARERVWETLEEILKGDWEYFTSEDEKDDED